MFVLLPDVTGDVGALLERVLAPHQEQYDEATEDWGGFWDWWQIGGRWTGHLSGYDPEKDPANIEVCKLCEGTGTRRDALAARSGIKEGYCNGCSGHDVGVGKCVKWPTQWARHAGDIVPAAQLPADYGLPATLVGPEMVVDKHNPLFEKTVRETLKRHTGLVVVVDYHS